jgi:hypothetical protein
MFNQDYDEETQEIEPANFEELEETYQTESPPRQEEEPVVEAYNPLLALLNQSQNLLSMVKSGKSSTTTQGKDAPTRIEERKFARPERNFEPAPVMEPEEQVTLADRIQIDRKDLLERF